MNKELIKIIKTFEGNVLGIGIKENLLEIIDKNEKILNCDILSNEIKTNGKSKKRKLFGNKSININKIRKKYKKKKIDYIICEYETISEYMRKFVKNSVYINKNKLYFYGNVDLDVIKRYNRYNTKIDIKKYKDSYIVEIDNTKAKNNFIKDFLYLMKDTITFVIEIIGDSLMGWFYE